MTHNNGTANATITAVVMAKSVVLWGGSDYEIDGTNSKSYRTKLTLTSTTNVQSQRWATTNACRLPYQVVEYY
jgi:hypothetical protein